MERVILVMVDKHLGNFVVASPVLAAMAGALGERLKGVVIDVRLAELVRRVPGLAEAPLVFYRDRKLPTVFERVRHLWELRRSLRSLQPALAVDLEGNQAGAWLARLSGAPRRVGPETCRLASVYTHRVPMVQGCHRMLGYAQVSQAAGIDIAPLCPRLEPTAEDLEQWALFAGSAGLAPGEPFACVHPGGGRDEKCWPEGQFGALTFRLRRMGLRTLLIGGPPDRVRAARIRARSAPDVLDATDRLPLGVLLAGFAHCAVFIGNDSGPAHLAAATGALAVVLFGPTDPEEWAPLGATVRVLRGRQPVAGSAANWSADARSMESISLSTVALAALRLARAGRAVATPGCVPPRGRPLSSTSFPANDMMIGS